MARVAYFGHMISHEEKQEQEWKEDLMHMLQRELHVAFENGVRKRFLATFSRLRGERERHTHRK